MKITAIILAAGSGRRMNSDIKKQYIEILGKPVIWYTINSFQNSSVDEIVLVTGKGEIEYCEELVSKNNFDKVSKIITGGKERYNSVYEGLNAVENVDYILIHDGARPLIEIKTIEKAIAMVKECGACIVGVPVKDTIKVVENGCVTQTPDRSKLWNIQTPQAFEYELIKQAYEKMMSENVVGITDDAMVMELYSDKNVCVVEGEYTNIKITTSEDLMTAEKFLKKVEKKC